MEDKRLASLPLSKEVLDRTPLEVIELLLRLLSRIDELESRLNKHSGNSDKPPSSDSPFRRRSEAKPKQSSVRKRIGSRQKLFAPTEAIPLVPSHCFCGGVHFKDVEPFYTHQILELPQTNVHVEHHVLYRARCVACGKLAKAALPLEKRSGYGPRLSAMVVELAGCHGDSRRAVQDFLFSVLGISVSQGAIQKIIARGNKALHPWYDEVTEITQAASVNHIDETSWKTGKLLRWLWVMSTNVAARFMVHPHRSYEAFAALTGSWAGLLISDGYALYRKWIHGRQTCLAHLIRRAKGISESSCPEVAACGLWTLNELRRLCHMAEEAPTSGEWSAFYARLMRLFKRYRDRKDKAGALVRHLMRELGSLWTFLREPGVAATNNHAERLLRFPVIWRKRSFGTRTRQGEEFVERLLSFRQTCRLRGKRTYPYLVEAFASYLSGSKPATFFSDTREPCRSVNSARSLLSL
jgi:transposase